MPYFLQHLFLRPINSIVPFLSCDQMCVVMGNLSSRTLKCHIWLTIQTKTHVCHAPSVVNDL